MLFAGFDSFDACVHAQVEKGESEESARAICGRLQAEADGESAEMLEGQEVEVFRAGDYGAKGRWTPQQLEQIAADYNPEVHEAPVVIGHPAHDKPAFAWVEKLRAAGGRLFARLKQVQPAFTDMVKQGLFKQRSVALYTAFPQTGRPYLRHLGFLGAQPPEVKGLQPIALEEKGEFVSVEFDNKEEPEMTAEEIRKTVSESVRSFFAPIFGEKKEPSFTEADLERVAGEAAAKAVKPFEEKVTKLADENAQLKQQLAQAATEGQLARFDEKVAALRTAGKVIPAMNGTIHLLRERVAQGGDITFSEGEGDKKTETKQPVLDFALAQLDALPQVVPLGELAGAEVKRGKVVQFAEPSRGQSIERQGVAERMAALAGDIRKEHPQWNDTQVYAEALTRAQRAGEGEGPGSMTAGQA